MPNLYGYMRISTKEERGKQKFTRQQQALDRYAKEINEDFVIIFCEDQSGKSFGTRPEWKKLERIVHPDDTIVFKSVDRFTRNADEGIAKYLELMEKGVNLIFLDNPTLSTDYMKNLLNIAEKQEDRIAKESLKFISRILLIAELDRCEQERLRISRRTIDGMNARKAAAEAEGVYWAAGRKPGQLDKMTDALKKDIKAYLADRRIKAVSIMKKHHISRNTLAKYAEIVREEQNT